MDNKQSHLGMIQAVVNRLSSNSFLLKGWSVVLVSAMFVFAAKDSKMIFIYLAYFPAISFWGLDGYFLHQERLFRALYDHVRVLDEKDIDFSMNIFIVKSKVDSWAAVTLSKTLLVFHGVIVVTIVLVMCLGLAMK
ncbi:MAG: hypothetical protein GX151_08595 [Gammaproteobacteria bacterium]|nr:hypothetical protein [Gammaproteobacteria bacterium]